MVQYFLDCYTTDETKRRLEIWLFFRLFEHCEPIPEKASSVAALPYDVVTREEAKMIGDKNPDSFLHVDRPEMDLPDETDLYDAKVYDKARANLTEYGKKRYP